MTFRFLPFKLNHLQFQPETAFFIPTRKCEKCYKYFSEQSHFKLHISPPFFFHVLFSKQMTCPPSFSHFTQKCVKNPPNSSILFMNDCKWFFLCVFYIFPLFSMPKIIFFPWFALKTCQNPPHSISMSCSSIQFMPTKHLPTSFMYVINRISTHIVPSKIPKLTNFLQKNHTKITTGSTFLN